MVIRDCEIRQRCSSKFSDAGFDGVSSIKDERERLSVEYSICWMWIYYCIRRRSWEIFPSLNIAPYLNCAYSKSEMSVDEVQTLLREKKGLLIVEEEIY